MTMKTGFMRNLAIITIVSVLVVSCTVVAFGYMFSRSGNVQNVFKPAQVSCVVDEQFNSQSGVKDVIKVINTSNIDCAIRLRLVSYWMDDDGNRVGKASVMPSFEIDGENWVPSVATATIPAEEHTYYYKWKVKPDGETDNLLKAGSEITLEDGKYNGKAVRQVVEVFAEAIQAEPTDARENAWLNGQAVTEAKPTPAP